MKTKDNKLKYFSAIVVLVLTLLNPYLSLQVHAYSNAALMQDLKVGLVSMANSDLKVVLNGNYTLNGTQFSTGTTLNIKFIGGTVNINGINYIDPKLSPLSQNNYIVLSSGTSIYKYKGSFLFKVLSDKLLPINSIDMDNYLKGVVGYEMSDYFPIEALKAQAVSARNFALSNIGAESAKGYDLDDTPSYQVYKGYDANLKNTIRAVDETSGVVLLYNDRLVEALYSASHGGYTEDSINVWGNPSAYLKSKQDSFDNEAWPLKSSIIFTKSQIESILKSKGYISSTDAFTSLDISSITRYISGRVSNINIIYSDASGAVKTKSITRDRTRTFLGLPSNMYNVTYDSTTGIYTFSGKGYGHGLGMSQIGAKNRAAAGQSYEDILKFYYDGTYITKAIPVDASADFNIPQIENNSKLNIIAETALNIMSNKDLTGK